MEKEKRTHLHRGTNYKLPSERVRRRESKVTGETSQPSERSLSVKVTRATASQIPPRIIKRLADQTKNERNGLPVVVISESE